MNSRWLAAAAAGTLLLGAGISAQTSLQQVLKDTAVGAHWIYDDYDRAVAQAKASGKPIMALFR